ncbi:TIGR01777 family oxidoreductase [Verrucomicrobiales bacterium]|nr:TIGR01777 family oxidoreductase [Verrucomicrobiales bacterium]
MKKRIILAGGSGFLGRALAAELETRGYDPVILTRNPDRYEGDGRALFWDGKTIADEWKTEIDGAHAIINLTGKNVNCRPTAKNKELIVTSRTDSVRVLGEAIREVKTPPPIWIQTSSLAIYGDAKERICCEAARVDDHWPAYVCTAWEEELGRAILPTTQWSVLRIGFVLGKNEGALPFLAKLVKCGLGGSIGNGKQWISWLHIDDMIAIFMEVLENPEFAGVYNATNPNAVTNAELMKTLRTVLNRPWSPPAPAFAVHIGAPILGSDPVIALTGRRCISKRLADFDFKFPHLEPALRDLF